MKRVLLDLLIRAGVYPHILFTYRPFKVLEFRAMVAAAPWRGDETILDIGCGSGLQTLLLGKRCRRVVGVDIDDEALARARWLGERVAPRHGFEVEFRSGPVEAQGFADASFDRVFSICVLEHIPNYDEVLAECFRVLRPGGAIVFTVDTLETISDPALVERHRRDHGVVQYFREDSLRDTLSRHGFAVETVEPLFRSDFARRLFEQGIAGVEFEFGRLRSLPLLRRLEHAEARVAPERRQGIFLLAVARRPAGAREVLTTAAP
jgi:ubiquinone/menaquinone biosynthesis C-methylase UbiE